MAAGDVLGPASGMFKDTFVKVGTQYSWVLWVLLGLAVVFGIIGILVMIGNKKKQWTHTLKLRRVLINGQLSASETIKMRRYPLIREAEIFELEKSLLGSYLLADLGSYSGKNEYSIIISSSNRIYTPTAEVFCPETGSLNVSARHSEIDLSLGDFKQKYQEVHKTKKRVEWAEIAKYAAFVLLIIAVMVVSIKGIEAWGNAQTEKANADVSFSSAMDNLADASENFEEYANTQVLIIDKLNQLYGTTNLQGTIKNAKNQTL